MYAKPRMLKQVLSLSTIVFLSVSTAAIPAEPVHEVRGHAVWSLDPPAAIDQVTINASVDGSGAVKGSIAVWPSIYLAPPGQSVPDFAGWTWVIRLNELNVMGNVAQVKGVIVFDNRFPDNVGCSISFMIKDNGTEASDPPDELQVSNCYYESPWFPVLGGNFTVK